VRIGKSLTRPASRPVHLCDILCVVSCVASVGAAQDTLIATRTAAFPTFNANWLGRWSYIYQVCFGREGKQQTDCCCTSAAACNSCPDSPANRVQRSGPTRQLHPGCLTRAAVHDVLFSIPQHSTAQHNTEQHSTAQRSAAPAHRVQV
jgi:hypothetical protein